MPEPIKVPEDGRDLQVIASVSGGKDSTALILALREAEIPARYVFADTKWEATETYDYLETLRTQLGITIDVAGVDGGMLARCRHRAGFPGRMQRFCTRELKIEPLRAYHDQVTEETGRETINAMGVRADESEARSKMPAWEDDEQWGGYLWRPLIAWTVADVIAIHRRHNVPMNPLYHVGFDRVGCFPCIFASKEEIRLLAERYPHRIDEIREAERAMTALRGERNAERPGRYAHEEASFFQTIRQGFTGIDAVVHWARTDHGGRQYSLFPAAPRGGCMRWGLCETAPTK